MPLAHPWLALLWFIGVAMTAGSMAYSLVAWFAVRVAPRAARPAAGGMPPVTVLKPLCGVEPDTYACLRSFCDQDYPVFQIVFGVSNEADPAVAVVHRLQREFPERDLQLVIDRRRHGSSRKVSNLINMMPRASHEYLVLADSDVRVTCDYIARIVAPLLEDDVGIVTCSYRGKSRGGLWSILGTLFINEWFLPSVRVSAITGSRSFAFGATIAMRRRVLHVIGGFSAIVNQLADDYRLGELTRRLGLRTVLSDVVVEVCVSEGSFAELVQHELRWLRTIRALRPVGYGLSFVTFGVPVAGVGAMLAEHAAPALAMLAVTAVARAMLHVRMRERGEPSLWWLLPARDVLSLALWSWSFVTRRVRWRDDHYLVARDGSVLPV